MEHVDRLRVGLEKLNSVCSALDENQSRSVFRPWSQSEYLARLFTFKPGSWNTRRKGCESNRAALLGWTCIGSDTIECRICGSRVSQPWFSDLTSNLGIESVGSLSYLIVLFLADEIEHNYLAELTDRHGNDCPWRMESASDELQYCRVPLTKLRKKALQDRSELLSHLNLIALQNPAGHSVKPSATLAICGWKLSRTNMIECVFGCTADTAPDTEFHPILEHRWNCPAVFLDPQKPTECGWKGNLELYMNDSASSRSSSPLGF